MYYIQMATPASRGLCCLVHVLGGAAVVGVRGITSSGHLSSSPSHQEGIEGSRQNSKTQTPENFTNKSNKEPQQATTMASRRTRTKTGMAAYEVFPTLRASRVLAISDLHVDYKENLDMVKSWTSEKYRRDALIVAGDVTDNVQLLESTLRHLKAHFAHVFFVPGNHELWIRPKETVKDSVVKFKNILKICDRIGVHTRPARLVLLPTKKTRARRNVSTSSFHEASLSDVESDAESDDEGARAPRVGGRPNLSVISDPEDDSDDDSVISRLISKRGPQALWIVPLQSWYSTPQEDEQDSLYVKPTIWKEDANASDKMWMDNHLCRFPARLPHGMTRSQYFASFNEDYLKLSYHDAPVITFSHVLPRQDLLKPTPEDQSEVNKERRKKGLSDIPPFKGVPGGFNFTRFAGAKIVEKQLRLVGSSVHIFGHQHRNRDRVVEGVRYVQHCVGNCKEQKDGWTYGLDFWNGPKQVWPRV